MPLAFFSMQIKKYKETIVEAKEFEDLKTRHNDFLP